MSEIDFEKAQREETRWRILRILDAGRPVAVLENIILRTLEDIRLPLTLNGLRRELNYLAERDLIRIVDRKAPIWSVEMTRYGIDIVEYTIDCHPGISRPPRN